MSREITNHCVVQIRHDHQAGRHLARCTGSISLGRHRPDCEHSVALWCMLDVASRIRMQNSSDAPLIRIKGSFGGQR